MVENASDATQRTAWIVRLFGHGSGDLVQVLCERLVADRFGAALEEMSAAASWEELADRAVAEGLVLPREPVAILRATEGEPAGELNTAGWPPLRHPRARNALG